MTDTKLSRGSDHRADLEALEVAGGLDPKAIVEQIASSRRRQRRDAFSLVVAFALLALPAIAAYGLAAGQTPEYEATADVLFAIERAQFGERETILANSKILAERPALAATVADELGVDAADFLDRRSVEIASPDGGVSRDASSSVLRFRVEGTDVDRVGLEVGRWAELFVDERSETDPDVARRAEIEANIDDLQDRRVAAQGDVEAAEQAVVETDLSELGNTRRTQVAAELNNAAQIAGTRYEAIVQDLNTQVRLLEQLEPDGIEVQVRLVGTVHNDGEPIAPRPVRSAALGLAIGIVLAATYLFVTYQLRGR